MEKIVQRTLNGLDKNNRPFRAYKDSYTSDPRFRAAGKSPASINLRLSRNMLNGLRLLRHAPGVLVIGFDAGLQNDKAAFNILNRHGKVRDFLGVRPLELSQTLAKYPVDDPILIGITEGVIDRILSDDNEEDNGGSE